MSTAYGELLGLIGGALLAVGGTIGASLYWRRKGNV